MGLRGGTRPEMPRRASAAGLRSFVAERPEASACECVRACVCACVCGCGCAPLFWSAPAAPAAWPAILSVSPPSAADVVAVAVVVAVAAVDVVVHTP